MKLYSYFRSSAAYRVRIALNLKALDYTILPVALAKDGEQRQPEYLQVNPQGLVPSLTDDGENFTQSLAIIEYLEEKYPDIPLLPSNPVDRAHVRAMALSIACDTHPLNNMGVLNYLRDQLQQDESAVTTWYRHWITKTFMALEKLVESYGGDYCFGNTITMADIFLIPQMANARRFDTDLGPFPNLRRIDEVLVEHPAFRAAAPDNQPDKQSPSK